MLRGVSSWARLLYSRLTSRSAYNKTYQNHKKLRDVGSVAAGTARGRIMRNPRFNIEQLQHQFGLPSSAESQQERAQDIAFVCIDCEAFEFSQDKITEVGVCVLDTRSTVDARGKQDMQAEYFTRLSTAHFIIKEYTHLINKRYVKGHPDKFSFDPSQLPGIARSQGETDRDSRNIVLVGHDMSSDADFLRKLGFDIATVPNIVSMVDTQRVLSKKHKMSLLNLLSALGFSSDQDLQELRWLHNAGNDAVWTMRALVAMVLRETNDPGSVEAMLHDYRERTQAPKLGATAGGVAKRGKSLRNKRLAQHRGRDETTGEPGRGSALNG